ncbi:TIGR04222 domain-containing membrane protein [Rugosimonospora acidiphila]|uniref:TIGR04222 domain-containing membrane protein n=1 Tax=Rugosimonospora acidiphila TaxID=556531 RepID=UPI0031EFA9FF
MTAVLVANPALLVVAALVRLWPPRRAGRELRPTEIALLRSGRTAAVSTALVLLHARAAVDAAMPGTVRRSGALPRGCDPLARSVYESLARPAGPRELVARTPVRGGLSQLAAGLARAGLMLTSRRRVTLRVLAIAAGVLAVAAALTGAPSAAWFARLAPVVPAAAIVALALLPGRTLAGRRLMRRLRRRHSDLTPEHEPDAAEWSPQSLGLSVALYGAPALRLTFPRFAAQAGLLRDSSRVPVSVAGPGSPARSAGISPGS